MPNMNSKQNVQRNAGEYVKVAVFIIIGLVMLSFLMLGKIRDDLHTRLLITAYILPALCLLIVLRYRPFMKIESDYLIIYPIMFRKRLTVGFRDIKSVAMYVHVDKLITTSLQAKQNNTLIIHLKDGTEIKLEMLSLTARVRRQMESLLKSCDIKLEFITPNQI
jgi:hypothetical protein